MLKFGDSNLSLAREMVRYARPKKAKNKARSAFESLAAAAREIDNYGTNWTFDRYKQECRSWGLEPSLKQSDKPENGLELSEFYKVSLTCHIAQTYYAKNPYYTDILEPPIIEKRKYLPVLRDYGE